jgi:hypothetical protein
MLEMVLMIAREQAAGTVVVVQAVMSDWDWLQKQQQQHHHSRPDQGTVADHGYCL